MQSHTIIDTPSPRYGFYPKRQAPLASRHAHATYARLWTAIAAATAARRRGASPSRASTTATTADSP